MQRRFGNSWGVRPGTLGASRRRAVVVSGSTSKGGVSKNDIVSNNVSQPLDHEPREGVIQLSIAGGSASDPNLLLENTQPKSAAS